MMLSLIEEQEEMVHEFNEAMGKPEGQSKETAILLMHEEADEVIGAIAHLYKELADFQYVVIGAKIAGVDDIPKELADKLERLMPYVQAFNEAPDDRMIKAFVRVHESNMSKFTDGKPVFREDGKFMKPPSYKEPYLDDLV